MNNEEAYKLVNSKLTKYKLQGFGAVTGGVFAIATFNAIPLVYNILSLSHGGSVISSVPFTLAGGICGMHQILFTCPSGKGDEIDLLKKIKYELKAGINRFEDTEVEDFNSEFYDQFVKELKIKKN